MLEKDLEEKCRQCARDYGCKLIPLRSPGNKGVHDRFAVRAVGHVVLLEFKRRKQTHKVQPLQDWWQDYCEEFGILGLSCAHTFAQFRSIIIKYTDEYLRRRMT